MIQARGRTAHTRRGILRGICYLVSRASEELTRYHSREEIDMSKLLWCLLFAVSVAAQRQSPADLDGAKAGALRPGDNLYACSLIALDPDTGKMKCTSSSRRMSGRTPPLTGPRESCPTAGRTWSRGGSRAKAARRCA